MNKVCLVGNLTRDPELSTIPSGKSVCKFGIAVNRAFASANGEKEVDFFNITAWDKKGETCAKYLKKGNKVGVTGRIQIRQYEADGVKKTAVDIIAEDVEFLTPKNGGESNYDGGAEMTPISDDSLPF